MRVLLNVEQLVESSVIAGHDFTPYISAGKFHQTGRIIRLRRNSVCESADLCPVSDQHLSPARQEADGGVGGGVNLCLSCTDLAYVLSVSHSVCCSLTELFDATQKHAVNTSS